MLILFDAFHSECHIMLVIFVRRSTHMVLSTPKRVLKFLCGGAFLLRSGFKKHEASMKAVVQRVSSASVEVEGRTVSVIGPGLLVLVGIHDLDTDSDADYICRKVLNMRLFPNEKTGKTWDLSVMQKNFEVLLVSQFTLYGILKGNKPDFHVAMAPDRAKSFYASLVERFQRSYKTDAIKDGVFGAMMKVNLVNDGPVTLQLESPLPSRSRTVNDADAAEVERSMNGEIAA